VKSPVAPPFGRKPTVASLSAARSSFASTLLPIVKYVPPTGVNQPCGDCGEVLSGMLLDRSGLAAFGSARSVWLIVAFSASPPFAFTGLAFAPYSGALAKPRCMPVGSQV
jgi:hypothetical protein